MIAANLSKQQALDANPKAIQQINFSFYPDPAKQAQEVIFSRKKKKLLIQKYFLIILQFSSHRLKNILV